MRRNNKLTGLFSCLVTKTALAGAPLWSIVPVPAESNNVQIAAQGVQTINYKITNQSSKAHTLIFEAIKGITPITVGAGVCSNPFTLPTKNSSCILSLQITGSQLEGAISGSPKVCQIGPDGNPNSLQCYQPSEANSLHITTVPLLIGDNFGGGIVGCLGGAPYMSLVVAPSDRSTDTRWVDIPIPLPTSSPVDGASNTANIVSYIRQFGKAVGYPPARVEALIGASGGGTCSQSTAGGYNDWFLPAIDQLQCIYDNKIAIGNFDSTKAYWSSTSLPMRLTQSIDFSSGQVSSAPYSTLKNVRCARFLSN